MGLAEGDQRTKRRVSETCGRDGLLRYIPVGLLLTSRTRSR